MTKISAAHRMADELVEASLFRRATGYSHPEEKVFFNQGEIITHPITKYYPPDTQDAMFWLRNRQPEDWKEKTEGDVTVNVNDDVKKMTDVEIKTKIAKFKADVKAELIASGEVVAVENSQKAEKEVPV